MKLMGWHRWWLLRQISFNIQQTKEYNNTPGNLRSPDHHSGQSTQSLKTRQWRSINMPSYQDVGTAEESCSVGKKNNL